MEFQVIDVNYGCSDVITALNSSVMCTNSDYKCCTVFMCARFIYGIQKYI